MGESLSDLDTDVCKQCLLNCSSLHKYTASDCPVGTCDPCKALAELDVEISDLEARLAMCSQQRRELKTTINSHHDRLIHRFPFEITSQIFTYVVNADNKPSTTRALALGAVCKRWREITLDAPAFWANVTIDLWKHASVECFKVTQVLIERSRSLPLFLKITATDAMENSSRFSIALPQEQEQAVERVVSILKSQHGRWRGLDFDGSPAVGRVLLQRLDQDPQLDTLRMNIGTQGVQAQPNLISIQAKLNPRSLSITGFFFLAYMPLQCERLTKLDASMLAANELVHIIRNAPNLRTLRMTNITRPNNHPDFPLPTEPIVHNSLTYVDAEKSMFIGILRFFALPALRNLWHTFLTINVEFDGFLDCLRRSGFRSLTRLSLLSQTAEPQNPYMDGQWYSEVPSLTHLRIGIPHNFHHTAGDLVNVAEDFISPLSSQQRSLIFPLLQEFFIVAPLMSTRSWSHLCTMLRLVDANTGSIRPIEQVLVKITSHYDYHHEMEVAISEEDCLGFLDAQSSGVHVHFEAKRAGNEYIDYLEEHRKRYGIPQITEHAKCKCG